MTTLVSPKIIGPVANDDEMAHNKKILSDFFTHQFASLEKALEWRESTGDVLGLTSVCSAIVNVVIGSVGVEYLETLLNWAIEREVGGPETAQQLFRGNTASTKIISSIQQVVGKQYLVETLGGPLNRTLESLNKRGGSMEVNPSKLMTLDEQEMLNENIEDLKITVMDFLATIFGSTTEIPHLLTRTASFLHNAVEHRFPGSGMHAVASFAFLRYILPAIISGAVEMSRRTLVLVSKVIQNLANNVEFGEKEGYMVPFNVLLEEQSEAMTKFLKIWCVPVEGHGVVSVSDSEFESSVAVMQAFLSGYARSDESPVVSKLLEQIHLTDSNAAPGRTSSLAEPLKRAGRALTGVWARRTRTIVTDKSLVPPSTGRSRAATVMKSIGISIGTDEPPKRSEQREVQWRADLPRLWHGDGAEKIVILNDECEYNTPIDPIGTVEALLMQIMTLISSHVTVNGAVDWSSIVSHPDSAVLAKDSSRLRLVNTSAIAGNPEKMLAFFLNLYNILACHIRCTGVSPSKSKSVFFTGMGYKVGSVTLSLDSIEHGILRGVDGVGVPDDLRLHLDAHDRACIQFGLVRMCKNDPPLRMFKVGDVLNQLHDAASDHLRATVTVRDNSKALKLPRLCEVYSDDFGPTQEEIVAFAFQFMDDEQRTIVAKMMGSDIAVSYRHHTKWDDSLSFVSSIKPKTRSQTVNTVGGSIDREMMILNNGVSSEPISAVHAGDLIAKLLCRLRVFHDQQLKERRVDERANPLFDYESLKESDEYIAVVGETVGLTDISVSSLNNADRLAFFINLFNMMYLHASIEGGGPPNSAKESHDMCKRYGYRVGRYSYSLEDIEIGILSCNPKNRFTRHRHFRSDDPRRAAVLADPVDPRVPLCLSYGVVGSLPIHILTVGNIDEQLDHVSQLACAHVRIEQKRIVLPSCLDHPIIHQHAQTSAGILKFVAQHMSDDDPRRLDMDELVHGEAKTKMEFADMDWTPRLDMFG